MPQKENRSRTFVTAFARGLAVIEVFGPENSAMTLAKVSERAGLDRAVARAFASWSNGTIAITRRSISMRASSA
jgi:hypothetical protein